MRVIHLCFQLHEPFGLQKATSEQGYFETKSAFAQANTEIYQPLFAFLERNTQKFAEFRFSLLISGSWLELAERYDADLITRLQKLVKLGQVELIAEPFYHSLAFFYDKEELAEQVRLYRAKIQKLFGVEGRIFALPELIYNDQIGKWAEEFRFAGMLVGGSPEVLGWHSPNHVYEAMECRYLRLLFRNTPLSTLLEQADSQKNREMFVEKRVSNDSEEKKLALSEQEFQKLLELDMLRGNLVNLYFDARIFQTQRANGIISFFDGLVTNWLKIRGNHFVGAAQACVVETPNLALSVKESVSWRQDKVNDVAMEVAATSGVMLKSEAEAQPPRYLSNAQQIEQSKALYGLRREVLASEDEKLIEDWRRLTAVDYLRGLDEAGRKLFHEILADLHRRSEQVKKAQAVEISRAYTKKHDRGNINIRPAVDNTVVKVNFGTKPAAKVAESESQTEKLVEDVPQAAGAVEDDRVEVKFSQPEAPAQPKNTEKPRGIRKVIRRLVIE